MTPESGNWLTLAQNLAPVLIIGIIFATFTLRERAKRRKSKLIGSGAFENVITLDSYLTDETGYWGRLGLVSGVLFGLMMAAGGLLILSHTPNLVLPPLIGSTISGLFGGLLFGIFFPLAFRRTTNIYAKSLYKGEDWIANDPPPGIDPDYQLLCTRIVGSMGVGGILYAERRALVFVPHKLNRRRHQPVTLSPVTNLRTELSPPPARNFLQKLLVPKPQPQLIITSPTEQMYLTVPQPVVTISMLDHVLERLKRNGL
jgi:hypothetical protein